MPALLAIIIVPATVVPPFIYYQTKFIWQPWFQKLTKFTFGRFFFFVTNNLTNSREIEDLMIVGTYSLFWYESLMFLNMLFKVEIMVTKQTYSLFSKSIRQLCSWHLDSIFRVSKLFQLFRGETNMDISFKA